MDREPVKRAMDGDRLEKASDRSTWRNILNVMKQARERMGQSAEKFKNAVASLKDIAAVSGVTRKRMRALALAGGASLSFEQLEKKDLMATLVEGTIERGSHVQGDPEYAVTLWNVSPLTYRIINADGTSDAELSWVYGERNGNFQVLDRARKNGAFGTAMSPDATSGDGQVAENFNIYGNLVEGQMYDYTFDVDTQMPGQPPDENGTMFDYLENARLYAGYGLNGTPDINWELQDFIDNSEFAMAGYYPAEVKINPDDDWVLHYTSTPNPLEGDFNNDGTVDSADYVVWRKNGADPVQFDTWRANFGMTSGAGAGAQALQENNGGVPEASGLALAGIGTGVYLLTRRTREAGKTGFV